MKSRRTLYSTRTMAPAGYVEHDTVTGARTVHLARDLDDDEGYIVEPGGPVGWWPGDYGGDVLVVYPADPGDLLPPYLPRHVEYHEILVHGAEAEADVAARVAREVARYSGGPEHFAIGVWESRAGRMVWRARTWDAPAAKEPR